MKEKSKREQKPSAFLKARIPLWLMMIVLLIAVLLTSILRNDRTIIQTLVSTATPEFYGAPQTDRTFIDTMASPTPALEGTEEAEVSTNTVMCQNLERSHKGQFIFRMFLQSGMDLFRIDEDGSNFCRLTNNTGNDDYPAWSPDGSKIAYVSNDGAYGLYLMDADGNNIELLHTGGTAYSYPAWSPDGNYLVFQATLDEVFDIYRLDLSSGEIDNLTNQERLDSMPSYSPDGQFIVFTSDRTFNPFIETNPATQYNNYEIYMMNSDGRNPRRVTVDKLNDSYPSFSPDSSQIVYEARDITIMNRDGSGSHQVVNGSNPRWLADGRIAYVYGGIHTILPDGSDDQLITEEIPLFGSGIQHIDYTAAS